jgi:hypothetical protein
MQQSEYRYVHPIHGISTIYKCTLKVPKCEIFGRSDFPDFYTIKSSWVGDLVIKILAYYLNFSGS